MQPNATPAPTPVSDARPIEPAAPAPAGKGLWKIFSIISIGALAIAVVAAILTVMNVTSTKDQEIVNLNNQIATLQFRVAELGGFDETDPNQKFVEFPGLGVRVPVSDELAAKLSVEATAIAGTIDAYTVNYGTCTGAFGVVYSSSLTATMGETASAPKILTGDVYTAYASPQALPCATSEITDLESFNADHISWLTALESAEIYTPVVEEEAV
jgi:hypothetical protein